MVSPVRGRVCVPTLFLLPYLLVVWSLASALPLLPVITDFRTRTYRGHVLIGVRPCVLLLVPHHLQSEVSQPHHKQLHGLDQRNGAVRQALGLHFPRTLANPTLDYTRALTVLASVRGTKKGHYSSRSLTDWTLYGTFTPARLAHRHNHTSSFIWQGS